MRFWRKKNTVPEDTVNQDEHEEFDRRLTRAEETLKESAKRLRLLEIEAGIYDKPPLRIVQRSDK